MQVKILEIFPFSVRKTVILCLDFPIGLIPKVGDFLVKDGCWWKVMAVVSHHKIDGVWKDLEDKNGTRWDCMVDDSIHKKINKGDFLIFENAP